ncbi:ABC transporter substrate-binding protein [Litorimonas haliclonae]|uniref:ABC transporter substrate-binding protein n=1 Tax=Litorimonas haliclonae TaxID=2081977 RepID=UPI0039F0D2AB
MNLQYVISIIFIGLAFSGCDNTRAVNSYVSEPSISGTPSPQPQRIVSLDYCADQYVLKMVEPHRILAVSPDADKPFSYMQEQAEALKAQGLKSVRSSAEDVLILKPDLVVRSYGGGPNAAKFFEQAGVPVLNVGWAGDLAGIKRVTREMAKGLGVPQHGEDIVSDMEARLKALDINIEGNRALYMTPSGVTSGPGSLVDEMLTAAGLENFQSEPGWRSLPLERLAYEQPDMVAAAFFDTNDRSRDKWSAMRHPIAKAQINTLPTVAISGAVMSCGGWFTVDGIEALASRQYIEGDL